MATLQMTVDQDNMRKVLGTFQLNTSARKKGEAGFTTTELDRLVPLLADGIADYVTVMEKAAAPSRPMWVGIDMTKITDEGVADAVSIARLKIDLVKDWMSDQGITKRNTAKAFGTTGDGGKVTAYSYTHSLGLGRVAELQVIREDHLPAFLADADRLAAVQAQVAALHEQGAGESATEG